MNLLRLSSTRSQRGNVLGVTLMFGAIVGVVLLGCLKLIQTRSLTTMRSLAWNSAIPVLEAGIEEAFTHLRKDSTLMTANGWTSVVTNGNTVYQKRRDLPGGSYCHVTISNASTYAAPASASLPTYVNAYPRYRSASATALL